MQNEDQCFFYEDVYWNSQDAFIHDSGLRGREIPVITQLISPRINNCHRKTNQWKTLELTACFSFILGILISINAALPWSSTNIFWFIIRDSSYPKKKVIIIIIIQNSVSKTLDKGALLLTFAFSLRTYSLIFSTNVKLWMQDFYLFQSTFRLHQFSVLAWLCNTVVWHYVNMSFIVSLAAF